MNRLQIPKLTVFLLILFLSFSFVGAHEEDTASETVSLEESIKETTMNLIFIAAAILAVLTFLSTVYIKKIEKKPVLKTFIFSAIVFVVVGVTLYAAGSTIYLNVISETKGPVHWHADFEVWNCGEKLDLANPSGLANRIGSTTFHEHGDDRIHMEGVVVKIRDVSLHNFFHVVGATLEQKSMKFPTESGVVEVTNGNSCNGAAGEMQVFVYKINNPGERKNWVYEQIKLEDIEGYVLSAHSNVPAGDCIIIEFDQAKDSTDKICETYKIARDKGELRGS